MIGAIRRQLDRFRGSGAAAVTVPPMDGALRPNRRLEEARVVLAIDAPDNLATDGRRIFFSSGNVVFALPLSGGREAPSPVANFDRSIASLAANADAGLAIGLGDGRVVLANGRHAGKTIDTIGGAALLCPSALLFGDADTLYLCQGSAQNGPEDWKRDLMQRNASGSVWCIDLRTGAAVCLGTDLGFPFGMMALGGGGGVVIAESWRHQVAVLPTSAPGPATTLLTDLPGYPARLSPAADGGAWLCVFAPRSQMIEFVLHEEAYRLRMMAEVDPDYWMAPSLASGKTYLEPLQGGQVKQLGILKPWAPSRSYGLLIRLDEQMQPIASFHSRADGARHGITSCIDAGGRVLATSKGGNVILEVDPLR